MAYVMYETLGGPDDVLKKMRDFAVAKGWTIMDDCIADLPIDGTATSDGLRLTMQMGDIIGHFRSANGKQIFQSQTGLVKSGIGMTSSTDYLAVPPSGLWYDQPNVIQTKAGEPIGVGIAVKPTSNYRLYCNFINDPAVMMIFSLELEPGYFQHLALGEVSKVGGWSGGTLVSGSRNSYKMFTANAAWEMQIVESENNHLFGMSEYASTFVRVDVDAAPLRVPAVLWASAGPDVAGPSSGFTGKILASGLTNLNFLSNAKFPKVPHYGYFQSQSATDVGRNVNTLNCISVNLPLALYIQRDPDQLYNYSQIGYVPGVYAISLRNVAPSHLYEISYPRSGNLHQVFPHAHRCGVFGYDGISIKQ